MAGGTPYVRATLAGVNRGDLLGCMEILNPLVEIRRSFVMAEARCTRCGRVRVGQLWSWWTNRPSRCQRCPRRVRPESAGAPRRIELGDEIGQWRVIELLGTSKVRLLCSCGQQSIRLNYDVRRYGGGAMCRRCWEVTSDHVRREPRPPLEERSLVDRVEYHMFHLGDEHLVAEELGLELDLVVEILARSCGWRRAVR